MLPIIILVGWIIIIWLPTSGFNIALKIFSWICQSRLDISIVKIRIFRDNPGSKIKKFSLRSKKKKKKKESMIEETFCVHNFLF